MRSRAAGATDPWARFEVGLALLPWLVALLAVIPLLAHGFPQGHDWPFELLRVSEYRSALAAGQCPPYWAENLYGGYGSPVFLFYAPLFSAAASAAAWLAGSVPRGATAVLVVASFVSLPAARAFLGGLLEAASVSSPAAVRLGTACFVLHPYLLGDKWVRNANAEFLALCLLPIPLAGVTQAARAPVRAFAAVSGGLALVALAHNLTAGVAVAGVAATAFVLHGRGTRVTWTVLAGGVAAGLALSAFFWLPVLALRDWIRPEELLRGKFDYHVQFQSLVDAFGYGRFFSTGLVTPALLLAGVGLAVVAPELRRLLAALCAAGVALSFLVTAASEPIWSTLPGLALFQFPWRMLGPLGLVVGALTALVAARVLAGRPGRTRVLVELSATALLLANALPTFAMYRPLSPEAQSRLAALDGPRAVRTSGASVTVGDEYLPRPADPGVWRTERPVDGPVVAATGATRFETLADGGTHIELVTHSAERARLSLARFAFPGWRVEVDGAPGEWQASPRGVLELEVPAGDAHVRAELGPPASRRAGLWLSLVSFAAWVAGLAAASRRSRASIASQP
jgi:hypothetical protein